MQNRHFMIATAIATLATGTLAASGTAAAANIQCAEQERCYGVAKAGKNDCSTSTSACVGSASQDNQKDAWIYVPKGTCAKIAGSVAPPTARK
jgi:uncharacterized membrane protein